MVGFEAIVSGALGCVSALVLVFILSAVLRGSVTICFWCWVVCVLASMFGYRWFLGLGLVALW